MVAASCPSYLVCPLSGQAMADPVLASDGHVYDRAGIERVFADASDVYGPAFGPAASRFTGAPFPSEELQPAHLHAAIRAVWLRATAAGAALAAAPSASSNEPQYEAPTIQSQVLDDLAAIFGELSDIGLDEVTRQCIAVVGHESVGKSTLLERLIGLAVLPHGTGRVTTMPIRVVLKRTPEWAPPRVRLVDAAADGAPLTELLELPPELPIGRVAEVLRCAMEAVCGGANFVADRELQVHVCGPKFPHLHILDLPGFAGDDGDLERGSPALLRTCIERVKPVARFLLVQDANMHAANASVVSLITQCGVLAQTVPVMTKCDALVPEDADESTAGALLGAAGRVGGGKIAPPCFLVASRGSKALAGAARLRAMNEAEHATRVRVVGEPKATAAEQAGVEACWGIDLLRQTLQDLFRDFAKAHWVEHVLQTVVAKLTHVHAALARRGVPLAPCRDAAEAADVATILDAVGRYRDDMPPLVRALWAAELQGVAGELRPRCVRHRLEASFLSFAPAVHTPALEQAAYTLKAALEVSARHEWSLAPATARHTEASDNRVDAQERLKRALVTFARDAANALLLADDVAGSFAAFLLGRDPAGGFEARAGLDEEALLRELAAAAPDGADLDPAVEALAAGSLHLRRFPRLLDELRRRLAGQLEAAAEGFLAAATAEIDALGKTFEVHDNEDDAGAGGADHKLTVRPVDAARVRRLFGTLYFDHFMPRFAAALRATMRSIGPDVGADPALLREEDAAAAVRAGLIVEARKYCTVLVRVRQL